MCAQSYCAPSLKWCADSKKAANLNLKRAPTWSRKRIRQLEMVRLLQKVYVLLWLQKVTTCACTCLKVSWGFVGVGDVKDLKPFKNKMSCWPPAVNAGAFITTVTTGRFFAPSFFRSCTYCTSSPQSNTNAASFLTIVSAHTTEKVIWYTAQRDNTVDNAVVRPQPNPPALASQQCKNNNTVQWLVPVITLVATTSND